jgi:outer membrane protein assembly complex protein YaeT
VLAVAALAAGTARAQPGTVETVEVQGLARMTKEAFLHAFAIRAGDPYDLGRVRTEFRKLWNLGLFSDIVVEAEDGSGGGKVLIVKVKERPYLNSVTYQENKVLTRTQIEDRLKERKVNLDVGKPLNMKSVFEAESTIRDYLGEKGHLDARVSHEVDFPTETGAAVRFSIRPGPKTRIQKIDFVGNKVFSDGKLKKQLKLTRAATWYWPWSSKSLYHPMKWEQDVASVVDLYQARGYLSVEVRPPVVEVKEKGGEKKKEESGARSETPTPEANPEGDAPPPGPADPAATAQTKEASSPPKNEKEARKAAEKQRRDREKARKKAEKEQQKAEGKVRRYVYLTVPIVEGAQYRLGKVTATGNTIFSEEQLRSYLLLREGEIVNNTVLKQATDLITRAYGDRGYLYATVVRQVERNEQNRTADIRLVVTEDRPYYVGKIEFSGNTFSRDEVLRREMQLKEGDLFKRTLLDVSVSKINQLGYFQAQPQATIQPIEGENRVKITVLGEEQSRNQIQIGGGYSGAEGAFFTGQFSTQNFLGRGQTLSAFLQIGGLSSRYSISFVEPWAFNRPYTLGFSLFRRDIDYGGSLSSTGRGGSVVLGRQIGIYGRAQARLVHETVTSRGFTVTGGEATTTISSITPGYSYYRINNPYRPSRGWEAGVDVQLAGDFFGGSNRFVKPFARFTVFKRLYRQTFLAFHTEGGLIEAVGSEGEPSPAEVEGVPISQRYWIGGDQGPRIFEIRSITPVRFVRLDRYGRLVESVRNPIGRPVAEFDRNGDGILTRTDMVELGGDSYYMFLTEFVVPLGNTVEAAFFVDAGNTWFPETTWSDTRLSTGIEVRFYLPVFPVPLRLTYGWPLRTVAGDRTSNFQFTIGRSF